MDIHLLKEKIKDHYSLNDLAKHFQTTKSKIRYLLKINNLKTDGWRQITTWTKKNLENALLNSDCKSDVLRNLNLKLIAGNFKTLDRYVLKYNLDVSKIKYKNNRGFKFKKKLINNEIFQINSLVASNTVRKRVISDKLIPYICSKCKNNGCWENEILVLQLDHINGVNNDHRIENLRWLCPNCHSQTITFGNKNKRTISLAAKIPDL